MIRSTALIKAGGARHRNAFSRCWEVRVTAGPFAASDAAARQVSYSGSVAIVMFDSSFAFILLCITVESIRTLFAKTCTEYAKPWKGELLRRSHVRRGPRTAARRLVCDLDLVDYACVRIQPPEVSQAVCQLDVFAPKTCASCLVYAAVVQCGFAFHLVKTAITA